MRRFEILGVALIAMFAASVVIAAAASAVTFLLAEWLAAGAAITTAQASDTEGELEFVELNGGGFGVKVKVLCSWILNGTVGPGSEGTVTELLTLSGTAIPKTALSGTSLSCTNDENCTEALVWADLESPWKTELELMIDGTETFFVNLILASGFYFECLILGITTNELCSATETAVQTTNEAGGLVDQSFSDAFQTLAELNLGNCTAGGNGTTEFIGLTTLLLTSGTALTASSE